MKNYYSILGITLTATEAEIKAAYKKKVVENHPDKFEADPSFGTIGKAHIIERQTEIIKNITEAYKNLSNPILRMLYDTRFKANNNCTTCKGEGFVSVDYGSNFFIPRKGKKPCPDCHAKN